MELAEWDVENAVRYKWQFAYSEIIKLYQRKQKIYFERRQADYEFLLSLAQAALGGGKRQTQEGEIEAGLDTGEGLDEMSDEQIEAMKIMLGADYDKLYGSTEN